MSLVAQALVALVALIHGYFLVLEMFLWRTPRGRAVAGLSPEAAEITAPLAANQGLYNGFLAAGLAWSLIAAEPLRVPVALFFLGCVVVAGLYGGVTVSRRIVLFQALPGALAFVAVVLWRV